MESFDTLNLNQWQKHYFNTISNTCTPRHRADAYRGHILQLQYSLAKSDISQDCTASLFRRCTEKYSAIVDSDDAETGLNNYADSVLSLSRCQKNESEQWQSSLSASSISKLKSVQDMVKSSSEASASLVSAKDVSMVIGKANQIEISGCHKTTPSSNTGNSVPKDTHLIASLSDVALRNVSEKYATDNRKCQTFTISSLNCLQNVHQRLDTKPGADETNTLDSSSTFSLTSSKNIHCDQFGSNEVSANCPSMSANAPAHAGQTGTVSGQNVPFGNHLSLLAPLSSSKRKMFYGSGDGGTEPCNSTSYGHFQNRNIANSYQKNFDGGSRNGKYDGHAVDEGSVIAFKTAKVQLYIDQQKKFGNQDQRPMALNNCTKKSLGTARSRGLFGKFVSPASKQDSGDENCQMSAGLYGNNSDETSLPVDERLKNLEPKMIQLIMSEIMDHGPPVNWDDIAGLEFAKSTIKEIVVWPMLRPDIFTGLRGPPKGILLFGPPGTGKTLIGKCIACQSGATFFSISASSLTSKWVGEGEKMVRAMFAVARCHQPAVIFIDEIDSLLSQRVDGEHDSSRRIKTEFLVQLDGASTSTDDRILVVGATNRPQEIDEAARRRLVKRLYIPLPEGSARQQIVVKLMSRENCPLSPEELELIIQHSEGFSGADMTQLCCEAALGPIRSIQIADISTITPDQVRPIKYIDFENAFANVRPSVSQKDLELYEEWNKMFGCGR
uniref:Fidgetin-like protein 1 n=1 Tax=Callorhinchus milii TaxID=7868 RepID=K4FUF0_CALMI|nr:fidgetin-like protein 1-like protein [Callorhinchus milii]